MWLSYATGAAPSTGYGVHQHSAAYGEKVFESVAHYGSEEGVPGNERGFVVGNSIGTWFDAPVRITEGAVVTIVSKYSAFPPTYDTSSFVAGPEVARTGVMGYMHTRYVCLDRSRAQ